MRHKKKNKKLSRATDQRLALLCSLVEGLIEREKIKTTITRAKEASRMAEKIISWARVDGVASRRKVARFINKKNLIKKVFELAKTRAEGRPGGYTRITKIGFRRGDAAQIVYLEIL